MQDGASAQQGYEGSRAYLEGQGDFLSRRIMGRTRSTIPSKYCLGFRAKRVQNGPTFFF